MSLETRKQKQGMCETGVRVDPKAPPADLVVEVFRTAADDQHFTCKITTQLIEKYSNGKSGDWPLHEKAADLVDSFMKDFTAKEIANKIATLQGAGMDLFDVAPECFKE